MSKQVVIPSDSKPTLKLTINNKVYEYTAGATVTVPDEVAELIEHIESAKPKVAPRPGKEGEVLMRVGNTVEWRPISQVPTTGTTGYVLVKTASGCEWAAVSAVPSDGTEGQVLTKTSDGYGWADLPSDDTPAAAEET